MHCHKCDHVGYDSCPVRRNERRLGGLVPEAVAVHGDQGADPAGDGEGEQRPLADPAPLPAGEGLVEAEGGPRDQVEGVV